MPKTLTSRRLGIVLGGACLWLSANFAWGCSSCGNGSANPLYLYPYEQRKVYFGTTFQSSFSDITSKGRAAKSELLSRRAISLIALGQRVSPRLFFSGQASHYTQVGRSGSSAQVMGDPAIQLRYGLYQQLFTQPYLPQIELIFGYKRSVSRSVRGSRHPEMLDVGGTGFDDLTFGFDVWSGMTPIQFGLSANHRFSLGKNTVVGFEHPGDSQELSFSVGKTWDLVKLSSGIVSSRKFSRRLNSRRLAKSESFRNNLFTTIDVRMEPHTLRVSGVKQAAWGTNRLTSQSTDFHFALMRSF